jgi:predicted SAM-dependent methyltransferase
MTYALPFRQGQKLVELGGGEKPAIRPNVDARPLPTVDIVADISRPPLPLPDRAYDGIFCSYVLEHVSWRVVPKLLSEVVRVLAPGGVAVFVIPNTQAQLRWALAREEWDEKIAQCLFGDQDYQENAHRAAFSPDYAIRLFQEAGFSDVTVLPHGELRTDMIVEARTPATPPTPPTPAPSPTPATQPLHVDASTWTPAQRKKAYNRHYFNGGGEVGGYAREGYWDYPVHWLTFRKLMERKPESVLELGCARGFILKRAEDAGVRVKGLEVSDHCVLTRAVEDVVNWDLTQTPWPIKDKEFDLAFSVATLEHVPESAMPAVAAELARTCKRGLHGVDFGTEDDGFDKTHCNLKPKSYWEGILPPGHEAIDKEELEHGPTDTPGGDGKIKVNVGSFMTQFHYGWVNVDQHPLQGFAAQHGYDYRQYDVRNGLLFRDGSVDLIYACHFLEHLTFKEGAAFLRECRRVMKDGATLRIAVPDARRLIECYLAGTMSQFDELGEECAGTPLETAKLWSLLFAGHSSMYDAAVLARALTEAGFGRVQQMPFRKSLAPQITRETFDPYPTLSLFVDAVK